MQLKLNIFNIIIPFFVLLLIPVTLIIVMLLIFWLFVIFLIYSFITLQTYQANYIKQNSRKLLLVTSLFPHS